MARPETSASIKTHDKPDFDVPDPKADPRILPLGMEGNLESATGRRESAPGMESRRGARGRDINVASAIGGPPGAKSFTNLFKHQKEVNGQNTTASGH